MQHQPEAQARAGYHRRADVPGHKPLHASLASLREDAGGLGVRKAKECAHGPAWPPGARASPRDGLAQRGNAGFGRQPRSRSVQGGSVLPVTMHDHDRAAGSPRAACLRGPSSIGAGRRGWRRTALADDAADRPRSQAKRGRGPASGAWANAPGQPCQVCAVAGDDLQGGPDPRRRTGTIRCPARIGAARRDRRDGSARTGRCRRYAQVAGRSNDLGTPTCPRAPGKTRTPVELTGAAASSKRGAPEARRRSKDRGRPVQHCHGRT
jgi:hypothetical protein